MIGLSVFESIMRGLNEALAHARGEDVGAKEHTVTIPDNDTDILDADDCDTSVLKSDGGECAI